MLRTILRNSLKYFDAGWRSYCTAKVAEKTGMTIPELMLYKESMKDCSFYYCKKLSLFLKEHNQKSKIKNLQRKTPILQIQPQITLQEIQNSKVKLMKLA